MPLPTRAAVLATTAICAACFACGTHRRDFSADAGDEASSAGRRASVAPPVHTEQAGTAGTSGAPQAGADTLVNAAGYPPTEAAAGAPHGTGGAADGSSGAGSTSEAAGAAVAVGGAVEPASGGAPSDPPQAGQGGTADVLELPGGSAGWPPIELASAGSAGAQELVPNAQLCITVGEAANFARLDVSAPAVVGTSVRLSWALPTATEPYQIQGLDQSGCDAISYAIDGDALLITCGLSTPRAWIAQAQLNTATWQDLPSGWASDCYSVPLEVSP